MPADILLYAVIAAVMVFWLKNVIGTRHGEERERPNPFDEASSPTEPVVDIVKDIKPAMKASGNDTVDAGLVQIALADKSFDLNQFKENASDAFTMIVLAFAEGDKDTLRDLCNGDVYNAFADAIDERNQQGEKVTTEIHSVRKIEITDAGVSGKRNAYVTIRFTADETYVIEDSKGNIVAGHPDRVTEMTDKWTFSRDVKSNDPRWLLSKTEDDVVEEDGKTPLPDAG